ncbi:PREDICTED: uncharacterized protein LOC104748508 [Camelina sativa]|uniref:Uncharacterized protein LOC104748508 n=1 Tax=Camelina sativa TaxID=90675 RepID=A0ABM0WB54_CAMSA|nr:PREDICTED: uncharacterized protein LOC104748508 [Camelina sativa]
MDSLQKKVFWAKPKKEELEEYPIKTIEEVLHAFEVGMCRTTCTVIEVDRDYCWAYIACKKCNKKTIVEQGIKMEDENHKPAPKFYCEVCCQFVKNVTTKFWIYLKIKDKTGESKCMVFDSFAADMVGMQSSELLNNRYDLLEDPEAIPLEVLSLEGKTFEFLLSIELKNIRGSSTIYNVAALCSKGLNSDFEILPSDTYINPSSMLSGGQGSLMITDGSEPSDVDASTSSTPSSKRGSSNMVEGDDQSSTSKKHCSGQKVEDATAAGVSKELNSLFS